MRKAPHSPRRSASMPAGPCHQDQRHRHVSSGVCQHIGRVRDDDTPLGGGRHVHAVVAHGREGHDAQTWSCHVEQCGVDAVAAQDEQPLAAPDETGQLRRNAVAKYIALDKMTPKAAAKKWVESNPDKVKAWLGQDGSRGRFRDRSRLTLRSHAGMNLGHQGGTLPGHLEAG